MAPCLAFTVRTELLPEVTGFGAKVAVTALGTPATLRVTEVEEVPTTPTATDAVPMAPRLTASDDGALRVKPAATVTETLAEWVRVPKVPVTSTV